MLADLARYSGLTLSGSGAILATAADPTGGAALAWVGAAVTVAAGVVWPKVRDWYVDYRKTVREQEAADFASYKAVLDADIAALRAENARISLENARLAAENSVLVAAVAELRGEVAALKSSHSGD